MPGDSSSPSSALDARVDDSRPGPQPPGSLPPGSLPPNGTPRDGGSTMSPADAGSTPPHTGGLPADGFYRMERLDRGVVAVPVERGVFVSWRLLGHEYDPAGGEEVTFELLRDGAAIALVAGATHFVDATGSTMSRYAVRTKHDDVVVATSEPIAPLGQRYLRVPLEPPAGGTTPGAPTCETASERYTYSASDASAADLDGDGAYELILKWDPSNAKDNSQSGCTGNVILDGYELDGKRLWRMDLGPNIRAGAHYTQFMVYDLDGDGRAEVALKTAPGTRDGKGMPLSTGPAASDDDAADFRSVANAGGRTGYVLSGPEYLTVFDGQTGAEKATVAFDQERGKVSGWGDDYGNRVDRFLAAVAYLDDSGLPSVVMARGYYTRSTLSAWNYREGKLTRLWKFDSNTTPKDARGKAFSGQGAHSLSVANVDADPGQEIIYGSMVVDHDGQGRCSTGFGHGDALHVSDLVPDRPGLEVFMPHEDGAQPTYDLHDASTCETLLVGPTTGSDTGRGVAADLTANPGSEVWSAGGPGLLDSTGKQVGGMPGSTNFLAYWDGDDFRELVDKNGISKYPSGELVRCTECTANNGTKSTPTLVADLFGDFREEVIWRETDSRALRIYTTTTPTERRLFTLMHDPQYRVAVAWQNVAYNQPAHPSFALAPNLPAPKRPDINFGQ